MAMPDDLPMHYKAGSSVFGHAKVMRRVPTPAEDRFWQAVRNRQLANLKFRRQHPVGFFIADFYCHEHQLVIEVDGAVHNDQEQLDYDTGRNYEMTQLGMAVLRFKNEEVLENLEMVKRKITDFIDSQTRKRL
jgi:very-short-patch-repair endonuclease